MLTFYNFIMYVIMFKHYYLFKKGRVNYTFLSYDIIYLPYYYPIILEFLLIEQYFTSSDLGEHEPIKTWSVTIERTELHQWLSLARLRCSSFRVISYVGSFEEVHFRLQELGIDAVMEICLIIYMYYFLTGVLMTAQILS